MALENGEKHRQHNDPPPSSASSTLKRLLLFIAMLLLLESQHIATSNEAALALSLSARSRWLSLSRKILAKA